MGVHNPPCQYDGAGPWNGGAACAGGHKPGTKAYGEFLVDTHGGRYEGYNCRPNTADESQLSVHGTGRAVDFFPPDMDEGNKVAAEAVANHKAWGIQMVIWDRHDWTCENGWTDYGGPSPHTDHLHIEQTIEASENLTREDYEGDIWTMGAEEKLDTLIAVGRAGNKATRQQTKAIIQQHQKDRKAALSREVRERKAANQNVDELILELNEIEQEIADLDSQPDEDDV